MKVNMIKTPGGNFQPTHDMDAEKLTKCKTGENYEIDIKLSRNPAFLRKVMVFFHFCFDHWDGSKVYEFCSEIEQFDRFRKDLTILAGFYIRTTRLNNELRTEAESLSFSSMSEDRFQECYSALINAALKHIFLNCDSSIENKLISFF